MSISCSTKDPTEIIGPKKLEKHLPGEHLVMTEYCMTLEYRYNQKIEKLVRLGKDMGKCPLALILVIITLAACGGQGNDGGGLRLVQDVPLQPTSSPPDRILSATPTQVILTLEQLSSLDIQTIPADFVLVTPTLPPSKTPSQTPTITPTPTQSPTPTVTVTRTATSQLFPTSVVRRVTAIVANPVSRVCDSTWFFIQPHPASCPLNPPLATQGVFQQFQNGFMLWVQSQDAIYILYNDLHQPRWQVFNDKFQEGMLEDSPVYEDAPTTSSWQPRRGFGLLWRTNESVRQRIGWATQQWEEPYSVQVQTATDGALFLSDPSGGVFSILSNGINWQHFARGNNIFP